jgi:formylglycine-generating enzyme required for sulfatase activity
MILPASLFALVGCVLSQETAAKTAPAAGAAYRPLGVNERGMALFERPRDHARVVWIPAGSFKQNGYFPRETSEPEGESTRVEAFGIDETEVTNRQFAEFVNANGGDKDERGRLLVTPVESGLEQVDGGDADDHRRPKWRACAGCETLPALGVTGFGALAYARWVGGDLPRLPEWQKAASGPDGLIFPWGSEKPDATRANYRRCGPDMPMPVGSYKAGASPYGCFDMAGNVYERVYTRRGGGAELPVMIRGGSWASPNPLNLRTFDLCMQPMEVADRTVGFRCVVREGVGLPTPPSEKLRFAHSWRDAYTEAHERNVPLMLSLQYDTCGQCDRTKVGLFRDPKFVHYVNEHAVMALGHVPGDASDDPHPEDADGNCTLYAGLACHEHIDLFYEGLKRVEGFVVSPGNFILDPRTDDESREPAKWILVDERELPKWGGGADIYVKKLEEAQQKLGAALSREEWLAKSRDAAEKQEASER